MPAAGGSPVGFIGLGVMGSILVRRLLQAGFEVVAHNRTPAKALPLQEAGAQVAATPLDVARRCSHVFVAVTGPQALREVLFADQGVCNSGAVAVRQVCDLSTQDPQALRDAAATLAAHGIALTEAPMAGSVHDASRGTLQFLQGGDPRQLAELAPCFACWGPAPIHFGELGKATTAKLALNLLLGLMAVGLSDALELLRRADVAQQPFVDVLAASGLRSPVYERLWQRHAARDYEPRFALGNLVKDIRLCREHPGWHAGPPSSLLGLDAHMSALPPTALASDYSILLDEAVHR